MSQMHPAYLFHHQQLLVDEQLRLPQVERLAQDLNLTLSSGEAVLARDWPIDQAIPTGLQWMPIRQLLPIWTQVQFEQASRAIQLLEWRRNHQFCSHCGHATQMHTKEHAMVCPACGYHQYPRVQPCIITVITRGKDEILLARNAKNPKPVYGLIAGFVEVGETLEETVRREVFEEVGLKVHNLRYLASQPWPFPSNLMLAFQAEYASGEIVLQTDEIADAQFFKFEQLPEIPFKGSIAHAMIMHVTQGHAVADDRAQWL